MAGSYGPPPGRTLADRTAAALERAGIDRSDRGLAFIAAWNAARQGFHYPDGRPDCGWPECPHRGRCDK